MGGADTGGAIPTNPSDAYLQGVMDASSGTPATGSSSPSTNDFLSFFQNLFNSARPLIQQATLPTGAYVQQTPYGTTISNTGAAPGVMPSIFGGAGSSLSGLMPILLVGGGLLLVVSMFKK